MFRRWQKGDPITAEKLNEMFQSTLDAIIGGADIEAKRIGNNVVINLAQQAKGVEEHNPFIKVVSVGDDSIEGVLYNPYTSYTSTDQRYCFKPYSLRRTPFDGTTVTYLDGTAIAYTYFTGSDSYRKRIATNVSTSESIIEVITPDYYADEILRIHRGNWGTTNPDTTASDILIWEDMNIGAKAWAKEPS